MVAVSHAERDKLPVPAGHHVQLTAQMLHCSYHAPPVQALPHPPSWHRLPHPRWRDGSETAGLHEAQHPGRSPAAFCLFSVLEVCRRVHANVQEEAIVSQTIDLADGFAPV